MGLAVVAVGKKIIRTLYQLRKTVSHKHKNFKLYPPASLQRLEMFCCALRFLYLYSNIAEDAFLLLFLQLLFFPNIFLVFQKVFMHKF